MKIKIVAGIFLLLAGVHANHAAINSSFKVLINHQNQLRDAGEVVHFEFSDSTGVSTGPVLQVQGAANKPVTGKLVLRNESALLSTLKSNKMTFQIQVTILQTEPERMFQYSLDECGILKKELIYEAPDRIQTVYTFQAVRVREEFRD